MLLISSPNSRLTSSPPTRKESSIAAAKTGLVIKWNECGIISFECTAINSDYLYVPNQLPEEITDLDLNNGHISGTCTSNTTVYAIAIAVIVAVLVILAVSIFCCCCRKKDERVNNEIC